jgi:hypothetical protein
MPQTFALPKSIIYAVKYEMVDYAGHRSVVFEPQDVFCSLDLASQCAPRPGVTAPRHALNGDLLQPRLAAMGGVDRRLRDAKPVRYKRFECLVGTAGLG